MSQYEEASWSEIEPIIIKEIPPDDSTSPKEKKYIMDLIREKKPKTIVETGTHRGLTTCYMAFAAKEVGGHVYTYDPYDWGAPGNFNKFAWLPITHYQKRGAEVEQENIDFVFIDGFHEKHEVIDELKAIVPRLSKNATVLFHDVNGANDDCDVLGAMDEWGIDYKIVKTENGIARYDHKG